MCVYTVMFAYTVKLFSVSVYVHRDCTVHIHCYILADTGLQSFSTNDTDLFQRTFKTSEYFYCSHCKTYKFGNYSSSVCQDSCQSPCVNNTCSAVHMEKSVIYVLKDPSKADS